MKLFSFSITNFSMQEIFESYADTPYTFFFDGKDEHEDSKFQILCVEPDQIFNKEAHNFLELEIELQKIKAENEDEFTHIPFIGGLAGFLSYEFGYELNFLKIPEKKKSDFPLSYFGIYTKIFIKDLNTEKTLFFCRTEHKEQAEHIFENLKIKNVKNLNTKPLIFNAEITKDHFKSNVEKIKKYIEEGDIYQANISYFFKAELDKNYSAKEIYKKLQKKNPAPFSCFLNTPNFSILSCSPERLIKKTNNKIVTKPIKGTIPDSERQEILQNDPKNRAENIMITDLLRNDFSKICRDDSIIVERLCAIESFKGLHHLVSTVSGVLRENKNIFDVLLALFPGGSITGAPKRKCIDIIDEIEQTARKIYCGSLGYISTHGHADFNIAIRTILIEKNNARFAVGGGITIDSSADEEYEETLLKAQKILEALVE